ncbi:MAG TPA: hypothetical protein VEQ38_21275 [Verrucomicrobiae bacterium]|nr:hypothetical protein [Verrucomicrobiae bacterium]
MSNLGQWGAPDLASAENIEPSHIVEAISVKEAWIREDRACDSQIEVARHLKLHYSTVSRLIKSVKSKGKDRTPLLLWDPAAPVQNADCSPRAQKDHQPGPYGISL